MSLSAVSRSVSLDDNDDAVGDPAVEARRLRDPLPFSFNANSRVIGIPRDTKFLTRSRVPSRVSVFLILFI